ncbi:MAG: barstar family protein [Desulfomonilaceae bacterium]|nr:barstar family protein [Desulfomonilaceae bacterium]
MKELIDVMDDPFSSGVYVLKTDSAAQDLDEAVAKKGFGSFHVDGANVQDKNQFLSVFAKALQFPAYFGFNWDALEDCLTDLSWHEADGYVIVYTRFDVFFEHDPEEARTALDIMSDCADFWRGQGKTFLMLLGSIDEHLFDLQSVRH